MHTLRSDEARKEWKVWINVITCHKVSLTQAQKTKQHSNVSSSGTMGSSSKRIYMSTPYGYNSTLQKITKQQRKSSIIFEEEKVDLSLHPEESFFTSNSQSTKDPYQQSSKGSKIEQIGLTLLNPSAKMSSTSTEGLDLIEIRPLHTEDDSASKTQDNFNILWVSATTQSPTTMDSNDIIENTGAVLRASSEVGTNSAMPHDEDSVDVHVEDPNTSTISTIL